MKMKVFLGWRHLSLCFSFSNVCPFLQKKKKEKRKKKKRECLFHTDMGLLVVACLRHIH